MSLLQRLRQNHFIARCVLVWMVLAMGVAVASPIVHPQSSALVCSAVGSVKLVSAADDTNPAPPMAHTLECALCLPFIAPPQNVQLPEYGHHAPGHVLPSMADMHVTWRTHTPIWARGPPSL